MERILLCPGDRPAVGFLAQTVPLVAVPLLGENLLGYWMGALAGSGIKEVLVLAMDRPEIVRSVLRDGSRWGLRVQVQAELKELTPANAAAKFTDPVRGDDGTEANRIVSLDHLPGADGAPLFRSYRDWFNAVLGWIPHAAKLNRIGLREIRPGIWCGRRAQVAPNAQLQAPCWLGDHVRVGSEAVIGPEAILEDRVVVDGAAEVRSSIVGPDTYLGALTKLDASIAWGNTLINWRTGSCTQVPDPFLLCALGQRYLPEQEQRGAETRWRKLWTLVRRPWFLLSAAGSKLRR